MKKSKISLTAQTIIVISVLLLIANTVLGAILTSQSRTAIYSLLMDEMRTIASISAELIDGDDFRVVVEQEGNPSSPEYQSVYASLKKLQSIVDREEDKALEYVYSVYKRGDEDYVFVVDPDPKKPAPFGKNVVITQALRSAGDGTVAVDLEPYEDEWGKYYSAYCPLFDSAGDQVGVVGVDFNANYYYSLIVYNAVTIIVASIVSGVIGAVIVILFTLRLRKRSNYLFSEFSSLADDIASLTDVYDQKPDGGAEGSALTGKKHIAENRDDQTDVLVQKIHVLRKKLHAYIAYVEKKARTDPMTGVNNKTVYLEKIKEINRDIADGKAAFSVAVFDINSLKLINDNKGHELGDLSIIESVNVMKGVFGVDRLYRIGGDEFIAILDHTSEEQVKEMFSLLDEKVSAYHQNAPDGGAIVSFSKGSSTFVPGKDTDYKVVFKRADKDLYRDKAVYYATHGKEEL